MWGRCFRLDVEKYKNMARKNIERGLKESEAFHPDDIKIIVDNIVTLLRKAKSRKEKP